MNLDIPGTADVAADGTVTYEEEVEDKQESDYKELMDELYV